MLTESLIQEEYNPREEAQNQLLRLSESTWKNIPAFEIGHEFLCQKIKRLVCVAFSWEIVKTV